MNTQPIPLTPTEARVLVRCSLHYHFLQQKSAIQVDPKQAALDRSVRETIQQLHAAGGPDRLSLEECLKKVGPQPAARQMLAKYYHRLKSDWPQMIAGNESIEMKISIAGVALILQATIDRLDKTSDGGVLAILFRTENGPLPTTADLRQDHAFTIYHALAAATYPLKRPVRIQEWWLQLDQNVTIELSEDEYRCNLSDLRQPVQALARSEVMARPGLHCDSCFFKYRGCPVYAHEPGAPNEPDEFAPLPQRGKIHPRKWIFKI